MGCQRKLLLSFMVGGLMLFYGTTVATALTPQEIGRISRGSTVLLEINDAKGNRSMGSGFVIHDDKIATNYHVVEDMLSGTARLAEKAKKYRVKILVVDKMRDLAIVTATGIDAPALPLGNSDTVQQGDTVYVMGNPRGLVATLSPGIISAIRPTGTYLTTFRLLGSDPLDWHAPCKLLQMTAPTSKGSSGGPVLNESGEVIGIVFGGVPSVLEPDLTVTTPENLNFAIAVNYLKQLAKGEGIPITPISPKISPIMKHVPPSRVSVGDTIPLTLDLISSKAPRQVTIVYKTYDKDDNELEQHNQEMRLGNKQPASSTRIYRVDLPPQKRVGSIKYYIEVEYNNRVAFRYPREQSRCYQISIVDDKPPTISVLSPDDGEQFTADQQITFRAEVMDNSVVEEVHIYVLSPNDQSRKLSGEGSSDMYTMDISFSQVGTVEYYLTATDEAGKESRSENRRLTIIPPDTTPPTIRLIKPSRTTFEVDQQIPIEAKVTDGSSVKQVRLFYSFSPSRHFSHYFDRFLTETSSDTYTGHIPPQSKVGYIEYYLTATDEAGNESISEPRQIDIRPPPPPRPVTLDKGIKLYEQAKYNEAIEALQLAIRELEDLEQQGEAYLYLGGAKRGSGASNDEVKEEFRKAIRLNPNQELPIRVGNDHPIFVELLAEVRIELIGESIIVEHVPPSRVSVGETIPFTLKLNSPLGPQQVKIYYTIYDNDGNELEQNNQEMHVRDRQTVSSTWSYKVELPPQKRIGLIKYYIEIGYENHVAFKYPRDLSPYYQIFIFDDKQPTISVLSPRDGERFTVGDQTTVRAEVVDNGIVEEVRIYVLGPSAQNQELFKEKSSDMYTKDITLSQVGIVEYYLTATDEAGKESRSENRWLTIKDPKPPPPPAHPKIHLIKPSSTTFKVNQRIPIEAKVTDDTSVEQVRLFYSFSPSISEHPRYSDKSLTETLSDTYTGHIPPQSKAGYIWYYLTATDEAGNKSTSENRWLEITERPPPPPGSPLTIHLIKPRDGTTFEVNQRITFSAEVTDDTAVKEVLVHFSSDNIRKLSADGSSDIYAIDISFSQAGPVEFYLTATDNEGHESRSKLRQIEIKDLPPPPPPPPPTYPIYQGIWASVAAEDAFISASDGNYMFRLAYLREGENQSTLGAQLDLSYPDRTNVSAMFQWGPALGKSDIAFMLLGGIAEYEDFPATKTSVRSTHMTPILGAGLKFYPRDKIVIDATSSIKSRSNYDTTNLYHYEVGVRFYITDKLSLRAGYGKLYLGKEDVTTLQIGLGYTF